MSGGFIFIDRRKNPKSKSLSNRQRFIDRAKKAIRESAKKALGNRTLSDKGNADVNVSGEGISEPHFRHDPYIGEHEYVVPGNHDFIVGDIIHKPQEDDEQTGQGNGNGNGEGEDEFGFALTYDEFLDVIFDDLELPDLVKLTEKNSVSFVNRRAGYTSSGIPANLNVEKTIMSGIARRIALKKPKLRQIEELEAERNRVNEQINAIEDSFAPDGVMNILGATEAQLEKRERLIDRLAELDDEITTLKAKAKAIGFLDNVDMKYNNFIKQPRPITKAVMICIMDVSFSMGEREKIIAKKFFLLLNLFLRRRYENIDVVFIRHHDQATECDEESFFTSREGGGTVVSSAYDLAKEIIADRYNPEDWNIYMAQASDGDNYDSDNHKVKKMVIEDFLPIVQHFIYLEIKRDMTFWGSFNYESGLWKTLDPLSKLYDNISCTKIEHEREVIRVFRKLFSQHRAKA